MSLLWAAIQMITEVRTCMTTECKNCILRTQNPFAVSYRHGIGEGEPHQPRVDTTLRQHREQGRAQDDEITDQLGVYTDPSVENK